MWDDNERRVHRSLLQNLNNGAAFSEETADKKLAFQLYIKMNTSQQTPESRWRRKMKKQQKLSKRYRRLKTLKGSNSGAQNTATTSQSSDDPCLEQSVSCWSLERDPSHLEGPLLTNGPELFNDSEAFPTAQDHTIDIENSGLESDMEYLYSVDVNDEEWAFDDNPLEYCSKERLTVDGTRMKNLENTGDCPLYRDAPISIAESLLLIMTFANRHKITGKALGDLLKLITLHCPSELQTECLGNLQKFKEFFDDAGSSLILHKYCNSCYMSVESDDAQCQACKANVAIEGSTSYFIEVPVETQIKALFAKKGFEEKLKFRFVRQKKGQNNIEEIYDGKLYQNFTNCNGPLSDLRNISFMWNTDGIPIFKSSKFSVWPFYCVINELSFVERTKCENMIFAGLWFGESKPSMLTFLKPLCDSFNKIERDGVLVQFAEAPEPFICKVLTIAGTCDLPAKALVLNSVQFNGHYGCLKCEQPGQTVKTGERGHVHAFPFQKTDPKGPPRTHKKYVADARSAFDSKTPVNGVKGPTWLSTLTSYDLILGTGIDYMHSVMLGVMRLLMFLWFSTEFSRHPFSMVRSVSEVDRRISEIQPPFLTRYPRSVSAHRMFYKASEYKNMLFFGPVVFRGVLADLYYNHFLLLSEAIFILLMESITCAQIDHAEKLLWNFCSQIGELYGERYLTANMHLLVHLADSVRALGPLWTHSCFHFEDKNGHLLRLIHGTQNIPLQMVNAVKLIQCLPNIAQTTKMGSATANLFSKMTSLSSFCSGHSDVSEVTVLGERFNICLECRDISALENFVNRSLHNSVIKTFNRVQMGRTVYTSKQYVKAKRRNNYTVTYHDGKQIRYGQIDFFLSYKETENSLKERYLAFVNEFSCAGINLLQDMVTGGTCFHIVSLVETPIDRTVIPLENILSKLVFLSLSLMPGIAYAAHVPNTLERD